VLDGREPVPVPAPFAGLASDEAAAAVVGVASVGAETVCVVGAAEGVCVVDAADPVCVVGVAEGVCVVGVAEGVCGVGAAEGACGAVAGARFCGALTGWSGSGGVLASRKSAKDCVSASCVAVDACCHCEGETDRLAPTSDAILDTDEPLRARLMCMRLQRLGQPVPQKYAI
jgi:hypothetical protein